MIHGKSLIQYINQFVILLGVFFISCANKQTEKQTQASTEKETRTLSKDSVPLASKPEISQFKGFPDFLSLEPADSGLVRKIQDYVLVIGRQKIRDSVELENEEFLEDMTDGGGSLTGYFLNKKLVKIKEWVGLSWGVLQVSFYFDNNRLVFVKETEDHFHIDSNGVDHSRIGLRFQGEYYFDKNKLVDQISLGHNRFEDEKEDPEKEYLKRAAENRNRILKKK